MNSRAPNPEHPPERNETLWMLTVSPTIWAIHFMACYLTAAIWCAKVVEPGGSLGGARIAIGIYTALALLGILVTGWFGYRRQSFEAGAMPHDDDTPLDRHRFLGFATLLLSALSAVAAVFVALAALFIGNCD